MLLLNWEDNEMRHNSLFGTVTLSPVTPLKQCYSKSKCANEDKGLVIYTVISSANSLAVTFNPEMSLLCLMLLARGSMDKTNSGKTGPPSLAPQCN